MAKSDLGTKRICPTTGKKFYDLNKTPVVSPYTGEVVPIAPIAPPRAARGDAARAAAAASATAAANMPEAAEAEELVSLEEAEKALRERVKAIAKNVAGSQDISQKETAEEISTLANLAKEFQKAGDAQGQLALLETSLLLKPDDVTLPSFDTTALHAAAAVAFALSDRL